MKNKIKLMRAYSLLTFLLGQWPTIVKTMEESSMQETSDTYLRNVVNELQLINGILPSSENDVIGNSYAFDNTVQTSTRPVQRATQMIDRLTSILPKRNIHAQVVTSRPIYANDEPPSNNPTILGFTSAELAAMYRKALERGVPVKYNAFVNTINQQTPKIIAAPVEVYDGSRLQSEASQYAYYFYPLNAFHHELISNNGYKSMPNFKYDSSPAESNQSKSIMSPILFGLGGVFGVALIIVLSIMIYPRFMQYLHLPFVTTSRYGLQHEIVHLKNFVMESINYYKDKNSRRTPYIKRVR